MTRYNYTSQGLNKDKFDGYVVSYPKSGGTWVRTFIFKYFSILESRDLTFNTSDFDKIPNLYFTHDILENKIAWSASDTNDSDSFKARRGVVGCYLDYFSEDDLEFSNNLMTKLDPVYKYLG